MYAKVLRKQFEIKEGVIIHTPTGAEFTPSAARQILCSYGPDLSEACCKTVSAIAIRTYWQ